MPIRWITCLECGKPTPAAGSRTKYCPECAAQRKSPAPRSSAQGIRSLRAATPYTRRGPEWSDAGPPDLAWQVRVDIPFTWALSKNHIYGLGGGRLHLRSAHRDAREGLTARLRAALHRAAIKPVPNKVWIDIFVEKDSHRGDAINVIDGVCDGIKAAIPVDDRWYSLRRLDWEVIPKGGRVYVAIGQENAIASQVCHACGKILPLEAFRKGPQVDVSGRACIACSAILRAGKKPPTGPQANTATR